MNKSKTGVSDDPIGKSSFRAIFSDCLNQFFAGILCVFQKELMTAGRKRAELPQAGGTVVNDSPVDCQSRTVTEPQREKGDHEVVDEADYLASGLWWRRKPTKQWCNNRENISVSIREAKKTQFTVLQKTHRYLR